MFGCRGFNAANKSEFVGLKELFGGVRSGSDHAEDRTHVKSE